jgi:hypothetical protein
MQIEEIKHSSHRGQRDKLEQQLSARRDGLLADAGKRLDELSGLARDEAGRHGLLVRTRQDLNATKYIQGLLRDLDEDD